jgi:hypothetical protein
MKFITTRDDAGKEEIFLFPRNIDHDAMAEVLGRIKDHTYGNWQRVHREPIAAGFVSKSGLCFNMSESLHLKSRPEDTALLAQMLGRASGVLGTPPTLHKALDDLIGTINAYRASLPQQVLERAAAVETAQHITRTPG